MRPLHCPDRREVGRLTLTAQEHGIRRRGAVPRAGAAHEHARALHAARVCDVARLVAIPSVSGAPARRGAIDAAAQWLRSRLRSAGMSILPSPPCPGAPIVRACWRGDPSAPTVLLYGHYDVQPADRGVGWRSDPFVPALRGDRLYGRGATDNKGAVLALIGAAESILCARGRLPVNVEVVLEGEEEVGSASLLAWLAGRPRLGRIDVAVIADTPARARGRPAVTYALRGSVAASITLRGLEHDVHAGVYGGAVPDAARELARLLATLHDRSGAIAVAGMSAGLARPSARELARMRRHGPTDAEIAAETGARPLRHSHSTVAYQAITAEPSITVTSLTAGDQGEAPRNVVPASARARLDVRLAPGQDPIGCAAALERHLWARAPRSCAAQIVVRPKGRPLLIDPDDPLIWTAARALSRAYGNSAALIRSGGSIPVAETFAARLGIPTLLLGVSPPDAGMHAPNEFLHLPSFHAATHALIDLLEGIPAAVRRER
jgi:acetylornithine deacetylase/succinyl-diaminopimelate desuccinylase-like protein